MSNPKFNFNWYFLIAGILILYPGLSINQKARQPVLKNITVELSKDITNVKGRKSSIDYKFWTKEYKNQFSILNGSISRGKFDAIANLKRGQEVDLLIAMSDFENLSDGQGDIIVKGISLSGNSLMTAAEFYHNRELYKIRIKIFSIFAALMLILNGLTRISGKLNYIIIGIFVGIIVIMRILEIGIY